MFEIGTRIVVWRLSMNLMPRPLEGYVEGPARSDGRWPVRLPGGIEYLTLSADENGEFWPREFEPAVETASAA